MKIAYQQTVEAEVKFLRATCGRCYWEDAKVNGVQDDDGTLIPCRVGDTWAPLIDVDAGVIQAWPAGTTADIHYKVCDEGVYELLDASMTVLVKRDGYVPGVMCPNENGYGDYVIMTVGEDGRIANWHPDLLADFVAN